MYQYISRKSAIFIKRKLASVIPALNNFRYELKPVRPDSKGAHLFATKFERYRKSK